MKGVLLRVDNVLRPGTYTNFSAMMDVINNNNAKAIIDVTPKWHGTLEHDLNYINRIKEELSKGHILALHGVEHRCRALPEEEHQVSWMPTEDEFDCKDYHHIHGSDIPIETQQTWLREGNQLLQTLLGQKTKLLFPPAHAYNNNTLTAMAAEGFRGISDYGRWDAIPYQKEDITVFPFDFEDYMKNTNEDGSNMQAMFDMFKKYFKASIKQQGFYATFTHVDFSNEGDASPARLEMLDDMIKYVHAEGHEFVDPNNSLNHKK